LQDRAQANGVRAHLVEGDRIAALEPHAVGISALHVPDAGLVDFARVCGVLADLATGAGADIRVDWPVERFVHQGPRTRIESQRGELTARCAVNCAGLFSDVLARQSTGTVALRIVPFRGEYHELVPGREQLVKNMIYPVPDPALPFLGVHLTRGIDGRVHAGPNAVLALSREGYSWSQVDGPDLRELVRFPGFRRLAGRYWRIGASELSRSLSRHALANALQKLVPEIRAADLVQGPSGVRAQAVGADGTLIDDFVLRESPGVVHVLNAPSPAATASLEIGREIARLVEGHVG
jgi:L-2-hydroxyglutarate oxidase